MSANDEPQGAVASDAEQGNEDEQAVTEDVESSDAESPEGDEYRLSLEVEIESAGPCKKHIRVVVPRDDIDHFYGVAVGELVDTAAVPGFRVGHVPTQLVKHRFRRELADKVKQTVLVESLEQLAQDHSLDPINEPDLDIESIEIPDEGDFSYEFEVEVRPEFDLPDYKGIKVERPVKSVTDADVEAYLERFLAQYGKLESVDGVAEAGDSVVISAEIGRDETVIKSVTETVVPIRPTLRFYDAELSGFDELMIGAKKGDSREAELQISPESSVIEMRGETVKAVFEIIDVRRMDSVELSKELLNRIGVESEEELRTVTRDMLGRQIEFEQRQAARQQVLNQITESADWELPETLVRNQMENALRREVLEMQQAGFTTEQIQARENDIRQRSLSVTRQALKEHFVLDKIAVEEDIVVDDSDVDDEIGYMAMQRGESTRRVLARLQKTGMIENLEAQIRERKAVDIVLDNAEFVDIEAPPSEFDEADVATINTAICESEIGESVATEGDESESE